MRPFDLNGGELEEEHSMGAVRTALSLSYAFSIAVVAPVFAGPKDVAPSIARPPAFNPASDAGQTSRQNSQISFSSGRLSANFKNLPLSRLADQISHKAGVAVLLQNGVGDQLVSASFQKLPVDEGLRQVLRTQDVFFFYGADENQPSALRAVWIYPKGRGRGLAPVPPEKWGSTGELSAMLTDKDPQVRGRAIQTLVERKGGSAKGDVLKALHDDNAQVRATALYAALRSAMDLSPEELSSLALHDDSVDVRFLALQALSNSPEVRPIAEEAVHDPSEVVSNQALVILNRLDAQANQSQPPSPSANAQQENQLPTQSQQAP
jgi:hypothetical protein